MTAVDDLIADLLGARYSLGDSNIIADVDIFVAALQQIQGGIIPPGVQPPNVVFAGPPNAPPAAPTFRLLTPADLAPGGTVAPNLFLGGPSAGAAAPPTFRAISSADISTLQGVAGANKLINGDMRIDQRNNGAVVVGAAGVFTVDRWLYQHSQPAKISGNQVQAAGVPSLTLGTYLVSTVTASYAVAPTVDYFLLTQNIEGLNCLELKWGQATAKTITLSFWVNSQVLTGNFGGTISNSAGDRAYPFLYTVNAASTWELKTIVIPGDIGGVWLVDNGIGMHVRFSLGVGAVHQGAPGGWIAGGAIYSAIGEQAFVSAANGTNFGLTGVKVEVGATATPFVPDDMQVSLARCMRYFQRQFRASQFQSFGFIGNAQSTTDLIFSFAFPVPMRASPTLTLTGAAGGGTGATSAGFVSLTGIFGFTTDMQFKGVASGPTWRVGDAASIFANANNSSLNWDAEL